MLISLMKDEEIPQVAALEQVCFSEPWTEQGLRESFARPEYLFVTATEDGQVVGYAGLYQVLDEGDITNIAVLPSAREKGIGTVLTRALIEAGEQRAIHAFTLEVRVGNAAAIHIYEKLGFDVVPDGSESRHDIIQAISFHNPDALIAFCEGIQAAAPVDSYVTPEPWAMPGYDSDVIMAAGAFVQGSSIELSADGPIKPPYAVYFQGGLTWPHAKLGILMSLQKMADAGLVQL